MSPSFSGEWRAHAQAAAEFNVRLVCVAGPCVGPRAVFKRCDLHNHVAVVFLVQRIGRGRGGGGAAAGASSDDGVSRGLVEAAADENGEGLLDYMMNKWPYCVWAGRKHNR